MTEYRNTVHDFSRRTRKNLGKIEEIAARDKDAAFEITQLINSAIGLVMFPREEIFKEIPETDIATLRKNGWSLPTIVHGDAQTPNLRKLVRYMRNGFAHFNVEFVAKDGQIEGLYLWNQKPNGGPIDWIAYVTVTDLRDLFRKFAKKFEDITEAREETSKIDPILAKLGLCRID